MKEINLESKNKIAFHFDVTLVCNNKCPYCYIGMNLDNSKYLNLETIENTINAITDLKNKNPDYEIELIFVGGEPLLVIDNVIDMIKRLENIVTKFQIFSNLNFPSNFQALDKIINLRKTNQNFLIKLSWHDVSDEEYVKINLKKLEDFTCVTFLISDENFERNYERYKWVKENTNAMVNLENIRDDKGNSFFTKNDDEQYIEMLLHCKDSEFYNLKEMEQYLDISSKYFTICQVSQMCITFDGNITPMCFNPKDLGNVRDGINIQTMYCNGYHCRNVTSTYKKIGNKK